jgi:hypothetical protein
MKILFLTLTLLISSVAYADYYEDHKDAPLQQQQCSTSCTEIAGSTTCQTVCS